MASPANDIQDKARGWQSYGVTNIGCIRSINQDAIYTDDRQLLWLVADGMGGHEAGEKASSLIVDRFSELKLKTSLAARIVQLEQVGRDVNQQLQTYAREQLNGQQTGSTLVLLTVCNDLCALIWAGDSRCYRINRDGIAQVNWDHSHLEELVKSGDITREQAAESKLSNVITRAVGAYKEVHFDHLVFPTITDDIYLLCSDGLTNELSDQQIADIVIKHGCSQQALDNLLAQTLAHGGRDNVSIILLQNQQIISQTETPKLFDNANQQLLKVSQNYLYSEIKTDQYYQQLSEMLSQLEANYSSHHKTTTQKLTLSAEQGAKQKTEQTQPLKELATNNYPKVSQFALFKYKVKPFVFRSIILLIVLIILYGLVAG